MFFTNHKKLRESFWGLYIFAPQKYVGTPTRTQCKFKGQMPNLLKC